MSSSSRANSTSETLALGRTGEELAAAYLQQLGYQIVAANFTVPVGRNRNDAVINVEIDLVAYEGPILCFIEVKTRTSDWFAAPTANVDLRKQRQVTRAAHAYRRMFDLFDERHRFDVVSIVMPTVDVGEAARDSEGRVIGPQIELLRNFWSADKFRKRRAPGDYWN